MMMVTSLACVMRTPGRPSRSDAMVMEFKPITCRGKKRKKKAIGQTEQHFNTKNKLEFYNNP